MSKLQEYLDKIKAFVAPEAMKPEAPAAPAEMPKKIKAADYMVGQPVQDESGAAMPDGEHKLDDGRTLVIKGGLLKEIKPAMAAPDAAAPSPTMAQVAALEQNLTALAESVSSLADKINAKFEVEFTELKSQIKGTHVPAKKKENANANSLRGDALPVKELMALNKPETKALYKAEYFKKYGIEVED